VSGGCSSVADDYPRQHHALEASKVGKVAGGFRDSVAPSGQGLLVVGTLGVVSGLVCVRPLASGNAMESISILVVRGIVIVACGLCD